MQKFKIDINLEKCMYVLLHNSQNHNNAILDFGAKCNKNSI